MANNSNEIVVGASGKVYVGPYGTALPTDSTTAPNAALIDCGYINANGVTFTSTPSITPVTAWQSASPVRQIVTARSLTVALTFAQLNLETMSVAFGGGAFSQVTAGKYRYDPPQDTDGLVDLSVVVDAQDGNDHYRWVVNRCQVTDSLAVQVQRGQIVDLPVTFTALNPDGATRAWYFLTDDVNLSLMS